MSRKKMVWIAVAAVLVVAAVVAVRGIGKKKTEKTMKVPEQTGEAAPVPSSPVGKQDFVEEHNATPLPAKGDGEGALTPTPAGADGGKALTPTPAEGDGGSVLTPTPAEGDNGKALTPTPAEGDGGSVLTPTPAEGDGGSVLTPTPAKGDGGSVPTPTREEPTSIPAPTFAPTPTKEPTATPKPVVTGLPAVTVLPGTTRTPAVTTEPGTTRIPTATIKPGVTRIPTATIKPGATRIPTATIKPEPTRIPTVPTGVPAKAAAFEYFCAELAQVCRISGKDAVEALKENGILTFLPEGTGIKRKEAFVLLKNAAEYLNQTGDMQTQLVAESFGRLSDVASLNVFERSSAYYVYANGIVEGVSDGDFTRTRSMKPEAGLTEEEARIYLGRLGGRVERRVLAPDGQLTRVSKLKNMDLYPYILDSIPDSFYTRVFRYMRLVRDGKQLYNSGIDDGDGTVWVDGGGNYASPVMTRSLRGPNGTAITKFHVFDSVVSEKALESAVEEYLWKAFNVDYRKTPEDSEWRAYMREMLRGQAMGSGVDKAHDALVDNYLRVMKENHTVIECDMVRAEASTIFESIGGTYIRCYVHYRVVSYDSDKTVWVSVDGLNGNINPLLFHLATENYPMVELKDLKAGEWRDGYFDLRLGYNAEQGITPMKVCSVEFKDGYNEYSITDY